jgi:hypothetical protein
LRKEKTWGKHGTEEKNRKIKGIEVEIVQIKILDMKIYKELETK